MNPILRTLLKFDLDLINHSHPFPIHDLEPEPKRLNLLKFDLDFIELR